MWALLVLSLAVLGAVAFSVVRSRSDDASSGAGQSADQKAREALTQQGLDPSSQLSYTHYLYFRSEDDASSAAAELEADFDVKTQSPRGGIDEWAVLAHQSAALDEPSLTALEAKLMAVAERWRGEYDGWEVAVGA
jgi:Regulator of ribonuclease activity B